VRCVEYEFRNSRERQDIEKAKKERSKGCTEPEALTQNKSGFSRQSGCEPYNGSAVHRRHTMEKGGSETRSSLLLHWTVLSLYIHSNSWLCVADVSTDVKAT
jgi:hypothetical protein